MDKNEILLPYQKKWIEDNGKLKVWEKSRRIGASYVEALNCVLKAAPANGTSAYYMSYNKDMTRQFINDCAFWVKIFNIAAQEVSEHIIKNIDEDITVFRIVFDSGFIIEALPSNARSIRSKQGRIILDEAAFADDFAGIKKAALAMIMWGGSFTIMSTHNGEETDFYKLCEQIKAGEEKKYSLHRTTFRQAVSAGLFKKICQKQKIKWSSAIEKKWVAEIYESYGEDSQEELDVVAQKSGVKYFPRSLLAGCAQGMPVERLSCRDDFTWEKASAREKKVYAWYKECVRSFILSFENPLFFGYDFARSGDLSVIWIGEMINLKRIDSRIVLELKNIPFDQQYQLLSYIISDAKKFGGGAIDARGNGQAIAEVAAQQFGSIETVMITRGWYGDIFPKLKKELQAENFLIPEDEYIRGDFGTVTIKNGTPLITEKNSDREKGRRHGDGAVAAALCLYSFLEGAGEPVPVIAKSKNKHGSLFMGF